ncbi:MAG: hypothetical protein ACLPPV_10000 [Candidatus Korobacteraceae bacterium]|jgi:hypothetical protein
MRRWFLVSLFASLVISVSVSLANSAAHAGQAATQSSTTPAAGAAGRHGTFTVELIKPLDSRKLKEGDSVEAKLTGGITLPSGVAVPRGTKVLGHVTEAKARSKNDSESALGISFDKVAGSGGGETPIHGVIQAVAPNPNEEISTGGYIDYAADLEKGSATLPGPDTRRGSTSVLNETSVGVLGIKNMQLASGVLTCTGKEVKLDSGTRMLLNVTMP